MKQLLVENKSDFIEKAKLMIKFDDLLAEATKREFDKIGVPVSWEDKNTGLMAIDITDIDQEQELYINEIIGDARKLNDMFCNFAGLENLNE